MEYTYTRSLSLGTFPDDSHHPFSGSTTNISSIALALYNVMWAYDGWYVKVYVCPVGKGALII